jgi:hypothetical protein
MAMTLKGRAADPIEAVAERPDGTRVRSPLPALSGGTRCKPRTMTSRIGIAQAVWRSFAGHRGVIR